MRIVMRSGLGALALVLMAAGPAMADHHHEQAPADPQEGRSEKMAQILTDYLTIQEALAADRSEGVAKAGARIKKLAGDLEAGESDDTKLKPELISAAGKLEAAEGIEAARAAFKELSSVVTRWASTAKPEDVSVMYCPMAQARWVQRGSEVANPYYGSSMLTCGYAVGDKHEP